MPDDYYTSDMGDGFDILDDSPPAGDCPGPFFSSGVKHPSNEGSPFDDKGMTPKKDFSWPSQQLSTVMLAILCWIWRGFLPIGKVICLYGTGGVGKTTVIVDLIARITTGASFPDGTPNGKTGSAVIITGEDGVADTILPKVLAAGGDPEKVYSLDSTFTLHGKTRTLNLADTDSTDCLEEKLREFSDLVLLVVDPVSSFMNGINSHAIGDVRSCIAPLIRIAENLKISVVFIHHCNKSVTMNATSRASGSTAFIDAVRVAIMCCQNPDDPKNRRVLTVTKSNLAEIPPGIGYTLRAAPGGDVAHVEWESERISLSADELLSAGQDDGSAVSAEDFLRELLADGAMPARDVQTAARDNGFSPKCIRRAFEKLGGKPRKGDFKSGWVWKLPVEPKIPQDAEDAQS